MDKIKSIYQSLTVEELKQATLEIAKQNTTGILELEGIIRKIYKQIEEMGYSTFSFEDVKNAVTWEISRRWYNGFYGVVEGNIED